VGQVYIEGQSGLLPPPTDVLRRSFRSIMKGINDKTKKEAEEKGVQPDLLPVIRFHDLRHTSGTPILLKVGVNPKVVSERLGHADVTITLNIYSHVLPTMQRDAADRLNRVLG
jgi:integrase